MKNKLFLGILACAAIATITLNLAVPSNTYKVAGKAITSSVQTSPYSTLA
ncbi:hypothetical protein ACTHPW_18550 [Bacillus velezensis]